MTDREKIVREELIEKLRAIAFSDIRDYMKPGDGWVAKQLSEIDPVKRHALKKYWVSEDGKSFQIVLHDKVKALDMLVKLTRAGLSQHET